MPAATKKILIVEARDLDTDERTVRSSEIEMPIDEQEQRAQLADAVARLHPNAKMRSFGGGAASFLDSHRLVVAHYGESDGQLTRDEPPEPGEPAEQQSLFAA